jgi:hypothetical protein
MIKALACLIKKYQKPNMVVCEVGCWTGETTKGYIDIIDKNHGKAIVVDWFYGNEGITDFPTPQPHAYKPENANYIEQLFKNNLKQYLNIITIIRNDSKKAVKDIQDNSLDICFLDASHLYKDVKKDIELYLPKVKKGGILCGHDCEDINLAHRFNEFQLQQDYISTYFTSHLLNKSCHPGVIQAVFDNFGLDVEIINDDEGDKIPIWSKQIQ